MKKERRIARELALKFLFPIEVGGEPDHALQEMLERMPSDEAESYAKELIEGVIKRKDELDRELSKVSKKDFGSLLPIEKIILRIAALEIIQGLKPSIAIDEAVELAKKYGEAYSYKLINAILDALARSNKQSGII